MDVLVVRTIATALARDTVGLCVSSSVPHTCSELPRGCQAPLLLRSMAALSEPHCHGRKSG